MKKVLLVGATGHLGKMIAAKLKAQGFATTAIVRNSTKAIGMQPLVDKTVIADVTVPETIAGICNGQKIVVSALGKSVSPFDYSKPTFGDVDLAANSNLLDQAVNSGVKKFVYVSALGAENKPQLTYFRTHHEFSERLIQSGIDYSIVKPPALFSAFLDLMQMAQKGRLVTLGRGDKQTNPIYEGDLAKICIASIQQPFAVIEAGGPEVLSRRQINDTIQRIVNSEKKVRTIPMVIPKAMLPLLKLVSKNLYDKAAFFIDVTEHNVIAPKRGQLRLDEYVQMKKS